MNIIILVPVYNDWRSFDSLIAEIEKNFTSTDDTVRIVAVNDSSTESYQSVISSTKFPVTIINLLVNVGHQRAICIGLAYVAEHMTHNNVVVVMDSDGEDKASDILTLIKSTVESNFKRITFASRRKRKEGISFKLFYILYKFLVKLLTGNTINFGNFSCIPFSLLPKIVSNPLLWNHYSGSIIKSRIPYTTIPLDRGKRIHGTSKMNLISLFLHGLSVISIYNEILAIRIIFSSALGITLTVLCSLIVIVIKVFTDLAVPGWASNIVLLIVIITIQLFIVGLTTVLLTLNNRSNHQRLPKTFYKEYIESVEELALKLWKSHI